MTQSDLLGKDAAEYLFCTLDEQRALSLAGASSSLGLFCRDLDWGELDSPALEASTNFAKPLEAIQGLRCSKRYCSHNFHPILTKLHRKHVIVWGGGGIQAITFFGDLPNFKSKCHFEDKLPQLYCHYP